MVERRDLNEILGVVRIGDDSGELQDEAAAALCVQNFIVITAIDEVFEPAEVDVLAAGNCLIRIEVMPLEDFASVMQRVQDGALPGTVCTRPPHTAADLQVP